MTPRAFGLLAAVLAFALERIHKHWMLDVYGIEERGEVSVTPFLDLVMVWNEGVSYGLFTQRGDAGRYFLVAVGLAGAALFFAWMWRAPSRFSALSLALVAGGALSNVVDRLLYGAVADFFLLHAGGYEWYVFNLADVWIVMGVIGVALGWLFERPQNATEA